MRATRILYILNVDTYARHARCVLGGFLSCSTVLDFFFCACVPASQCGGDEDFLKELLGDLRDEITENSESIKKALEEKGEVRWNPGAPGLFHHAAYIGRTSRSKGQITYTQQRRVAATPSSRAAHAAGAPLAARAPLLTGGSNDGPAPALCSCVPWRCSQT